MRRGLMGWDADELPVAVLEARIGRLQAAMERSGLHALLIYTNLVRPSAVSFLTGFTPYWSEGILLVGRAGAPAFATALSKRVANWIRSVAPLGEIVNTPRPAAALGARLAADAAVRRVGIVELDAFPAGSYDDLAAAAAGVEFVDATAVFADVRRGVDAAERRLLGRADEIAVAALGEVDGATAEDAGSIAGLVEKHARVAGAEEAYIAVAPDLVADRRMVRASPALPLADLFALRASVAYKGHWVRRTRTFAKAAAGAQTVSRADEWFVGLMGAIAAGKPFAGAIAAHVAALPGAGLKSWMIESCVGSYPLQAIAASSMAGTAAAQNGDFLVLSFELTIDRTPWLGAAPVIVGS
jgi:Creatinase/Prolidase N-terminal domain